MPRQPAPQPLLPVRRAAVVAMGPVEVPPEIREAEGKTPAASGRGLRFAAFAVLGAQNGLFFGGVLVPSPAPAPCSPFYCTRFSLFFKKNKHTQ